MSDVNASGPGPVDLHTHTVFSDGLFTPERLLREAKLKGLVAVAITDHDALGGIGRGMRAGREVGIEVVPGVEMSCTVDGIDVHILGYYLDENDPDVLGFFAGLQHAREERARRMCERLGQLGYVVSINRVQAIAKGAALGRPHVAQAMVEAGIVPDTNQAFKRFIGYDEPAYVPKMKLSPEEAVNFIKQHHGVSVIAHPGIYHNDNTVYAAIAAGVDGIEVWHPDHGPREVDHYNEIAQKNGLLLTGGSDCHGGRKNGHIYLGEVLIPYKYLAAVKRKSRMRKN